MPPKNIRLQYNIIQSKTFLGYVITSLYVRFVNTGLGAAAGKGASQIKRGTFFGIPVNSVKGGENFLTGSFFKICFLFWALLTFGSIGGTPPLLSLTLFQLSYLF